MNRQNFHCTRLHLHPFLNQWRNILITLQNYFQVIDGRMEGVYGWIAVNYMLGRFDHNFVEHQRQPTVGALDMGGASTQITYEVFTDHFKSIF